MKVYPFTGALGKELGGLMEDKISGEGHKQSLSGGVKLPTFFFSLSQFIGNDEKDDYDHPVTVQLGAVVRTRFVRILPTDWIEHCSMRFEVIGCYENGTFII